MRNSSPSVTPPQQSSTNQDGNSSPNSSTQLDQQIQAHQFDPHSIENRVTSEEIWGENNNVEPRALLIGLLEDYWRVMAY